MATIHVAIDARKSKQGANEHNRAVKSMDQESRKAAKGVNAMERSTARMGKTAGLVKKALAGLFIGFTALAAIRFAVGTIVDFETGLVGVGKTTDILGAELDVLGQRFIDVSLNSTVSLKKLLEIGQAAGQLGVTGADNIIKFTDTIAKLGTASNLSGAEAATTLARLLTVTGENISEVDVLASVLVELGNTSAATEREIALIALQVAKAGAAMGVTSTDAAGLGAAFASIGVEAELAASTTFKSLLLIEKLLREGGDELQTLLKIVGLTREELQAIFDNNTADALNALVKGLARTAEEGQTATESLAKLGLTDIRVNKTLLPLVKNVELLSAKLADARKEAKIGTALNEEYGRAADTVRGAAERFGNAISVAVLNLKESTGPMASLINQSSELVRQLFGLNNEAGRVSNVILLLASALKGLAVAMVTVISVRIVAFLGSVTKAIFATTAATRALTVATRANAIGLLVAVLATVVFSLSDFSIAATTATDDMRVYNQSLTETADGLKKVRDAQIAMTRAIEVGDVATQASLLRAEVSALEMLSINLRKIGEEQQTRIDRNIANVTKIFGQRIADKERGILGDPIISRSGLQQLQTSLGIQQRAFDVPIRGRLSSFDDPGAPVEVSIIIQDAIVAVEDKIKRLQAEIQNLAPPFDLIVDKSDKLIDSTGSLTASWELLKTTFGFGSNAVRNLTGDVNKLTEAQIAQIDASNKSLSTLNQLASRKQDAQFKLATLRGGGSLAEVDAELDRRRARADFLATLETSGLPSDVSAQRLIAFDKELAAVEATENAVRGLNDALMDNEARAMELTRTLEDGFSQAFSSIIAGTQSVSDAFRQLAQQILALAIQEQVSRPLATALTAGTGTFFNNLFGVKTPEAVIAAASVPGLAEGGRIFEPSFLINSRGIRKVAERGPEDVVPVGSTRFSRERNRVVNVNMTINTPDANSFRRSQPQIIRDIRTAMRA